VLIASGWSVTTDGTVPFYFSPPSAIVSWSDTVGHSGNLSTFIQQATLANIVAFSAVGAGLANISSVSGFTNITGLDVSDNNLPVNVVNTILEQIAALGIIVGNYINVSGQNPPASPSGAEAQAAVLTLQAQGWSVTTD